MTPAFALLMILVLGYANQRGSTCAVAAADEIVRKRQFKYIAGFVLAAAVSAVVIALFGTSPQLRSGADSSAVVGGLLAAVGASINGRCAMGTMASLSRGRLDRLGTLGGFMFGAWVVAVLSGPVTPPGMPTMAIKSVPMAALAAAIALLAWRFARSIDLPVPGWLALIGLLNAALLTVSPDWTYTSGIAALARGDLANPADLALGLAILFGGGAVAARLRGQFRGRLMQSRDWLKSAAGGALMGVGSTIVPGGNDTMLLVGVPLLLPGLLLAYAAFWVGLLAMRQIEYLRISAKVKDD